MGDAIEADSEHLSLNSTWWDRYHHWHTGTHHHHHHYHHHHHHHGGWPRLEAVADDLEQLNESGHQNLTWWDSHHHWHAGHRRARRRHRRRVNRRYRRRRHHHHHHHHHHRHWPRLEDTVAKATDDITDGGIVMV